MNRDYAERKIRDALQATGGNVTKARQRIIVQAMGDDAKLLHELVVPHMTGIVAHAINRVLTMKEQPVPPTPEAPKKSQESKDQDPFGMEILKAIALGNPAQFGQDSGRPLKKQAASQRHIDAIRAMVSKDKSDK